MTIDRQTFALLTFYQWRHLNLGYTRTETGQLTEPHRGYGWTWRCYEIPRIAFSDYYMMPDREPYRIWHVDGEDYGEVAATDDDHGYPGPEFYAAINRPPQLTLAEFAAWLRIGPDPIPLEHLYNTIAGCVSDSPNIIDAGTPWARAHQLVDRLFEKGLIHFDKETDTARRLEL